MSTNQNELPSSNLTPVARPGAPEKWIALLAPILLTVAALALFAR